MRRLVTGAWPLKPAQLWPDNLAQFVVRDATGAEVSIGVSPSRALFPDGSCRSIHVQFEADLTIDTPETWSVIINGPTRTTTDRVFQEAVYDAGNPLHASMANNTTFCPADSQYWCDTFAALVPLKPEADEADDNAKEYFRTDSNVTQTFGWWTTRSGIAGEAGTNGIALATYEHGHAWLCAAIRADSQAKRLSFYRQFWKWVINRNGGSDYWRIGANVGAWTTVWGGADATLPAAADPNQRAISSEWNGNDTIGQATAYIATGWRQPWRFLAYMANGANRTAPTQVQLHPSYTVRFNMSHGDWFAAWFAAYVCGATMKVTSQHRPGRDNDVTLAANELQWVLDTHENFQYTTANSSAYLNGIIGQRPTAPTNGTLRPGEFPTFQLFVLVRMLIFYYHNIKNDARIPVWLQTIADFVIAQAWDATSYYAVPYLHRDPTNGHNYTGIGTVSVAHNVMTFSDDQTRWLRVNDRIIVNGVTYVVTAFTNGTTWETSGPNVTSSAFTLQWAPGDGRWYLPFHAELFAWVYAYTQNPVYKTWALRATDKRELFQFTPTLKAFGQYFGGHQQSAKFYLDGGSVRPIAGAHPTEITQRITYDS